jgi:hypothetical protein
MTVAVKSPPVDDRLTPRNISLSPHPFLFQIHVLLSSCDSNLWRRDNCCLPAATLLVSTFSEYIGIKMIKLLWRQTVYKLVLSGSMIYHATHMTGDDLWQLCWYTVWSNLIMQLWISYKMWLLSGLSACVEVRGMMLWRMRTAIDKNEINFPQKLNAITGLWTII